MWGTSHKQAVYIETVGFSVLGVVLYQFQTTLLFFVIPIVALFKRRGKLAGTGGAILTLCGISLVKLLGGEWSKVGFRLDLLLLDLTYPGSFLLGLVLVETLLESRFPPYGRIGIVAVLSGLLGIPMIRYVLRDPTFDGYLRNQVELIIRGVVEGKNTVELSGWGRVNATEIVRLSKAVFANTYTVGYFFAFLFNWVIGSRLGLRSKGVFPVESVMGETRVPDPFIWAFLMGWSGVLVSLVRPVEWLSILSWNVALLSTALYGLQGTDIIRFFLRRLGRFRVGLLFILLMLLFIPGLNVIILFGIPLLGVSELWIHYRRTVEERSEK